MIHLLWSDGVDSATVNLTGPSLTLPPSDQQEISVMNQTGQNGSGNAAVQVGLWQTSWSVLASFFGVQSSRNWHRDFTYGNPWAFIIVGLALTTAFVFVLLAIVRVVLRHAGM
jgi:hypothetical protein